MEKNILAIDCGNSSIRVMHGQYNGETVKLKKISQTENHLVYFNGYYLWDLLGIFHSIKLGLSEAVKKGIRIDSIGVSTWGVDFGLLQNDGNLISNPLCYRNTVGYHHYGSMDESEKYSLFMKTGILPDKINSMFLLRGLRECSPWMLEETNEILMISGLINYYLTGKKVDENSMLSTTQFLDSKTRRIDDNLIKSEGFDSNIFSRTAEHGELIGMLSEHIAKDIGVDYPIPVICVPAHDTASAVLAIPCYAGEKFAFVSSGTWGLVGAELQEPIVNREVFDASLTNEIGAYDTVTLLKNNAGMFLFQRLRDEIGRETRKTYTWDEFYALADLVNKPMLFDVNHLDFFNPECMADSIWSHISIGERNTGDLQEFAMIISSTLISLAVSYNEIVSSLEKISEQKFDTFYIVGGGSQNQRLNQLIEEKMQKRVLLGSSESTSLGNILSQLTYFQGAGIDDIRKIARHTIERKQKEEQ